jgi:hypothetical protein
MAYVKPGVEITQVQRSFSPSLIAPDLGAVMIGPAYVVVPMEGDGSYTYSQTFSSSANTTVALSGLSSSLYLDGGSVYVDLVKTTGATTGRIHLDNSQISGLSDGATSLYIPKWSASSGYDGAQIRIGYRAMKLDLSGFFTFQGVDTIDAVFGGGQAVYDNPLPFAVSLAMNNTNAQVFGYVIKYDEYASVVGSGTAASENALARNTLENNEVYALAPYTKDASIVSAYTVHVNSMSAPTEKHERIVVVAPEITFYDANSSIVANSSLADKSATARAIRDAAVAVLDKRTFFVRPDTCYMSVGQVQVQKLNSTFLDSTYSQGETIYAKLASPVTLTLSNGTTQFYAQYTDITSTVYANLKDAQNAYKFDVLIPVPGYFMAAAIVGQISGQLPEQGLTNLPIAGPSALKFSTDFFSESNLNTIAEGGNYIMTNTGGAIASRHQLSTNMNSVEQRELSITKTVDFVAKYIRTALVGFIGRSLITPGFLSIVGAIINGLGSTLVKSGTLNGFKLNGVKQDEVQKDVVRVSLEIQPKYPVNYIKVDLIF